MILRPTRPFTVGAFGMLTWDQLIHVNSFPEPGSYRVVREYAEQSGGTTGNMAVALARLGVQVSLASRVGSDTVAQLILAELEVAGCDVRYVEVLENTSTDRGVILVSGIGESSERTILWLQGARLKHGHHLPIDEFFARDLVIVDVDDPRLRLLLVDLPMHISPRTRIFGTMTFLAEIEPRQALELALRHDYLAGNVAELKHVTGCGSLEQAVHRFREEMTVSQVRFAAISEGSRGCLLITREECQRVPAFEVDVIDPTGAGDAFASGVAYGVLNRWDVLQTGRFANAMGALATRQLGARASLPDLDDVQHVLDNAPVRRRDEHHPAGN